jgi:23S rRNA (cytidine1920-2'-O)/16S rRNA (cytidine1409-2'-O)-methyltransferase
MISRIKKGAERLDKALVLRKMAESREKARSLILSGAVRVNGRKAVKAGTVVSDSDSVTIVTSRLPFGGRDFVSRGGLKLEEVLNAFPIDPAGWIAADVGASTGGFTDCLLQRGVVRVYAIDVGYGQLAWRLRQDPRVTLLERTHILKLDPGTIREKVDLVTIDVSFISLTKVLPKALELLKPGGTILPLVKPQFEAGRGQVGKGGIVRDPAKRAELVEKIRALAESLGLACLGSLEVSIHGHDGNVEFFLWLRSPISPGSTGPG